MMTITGRSIPVRVDGFINMMEAGFLLGCSISEVSRLLRERRLQRYHLEGDTRTTLLNRNDVEAFKKEREEERGR